MNRYTLALAAFVAVGLPALALAQVSPVPLDRETITIGELLASGSLGGVLGGIQAYILALYTRRETLAAIDTWREVRLLVVGMLLVGPTAFLGLQPLNMATPITVGITVAVAFLASLRANTDAIVPPVMLPPDGAE